MSMLDWIRRRDGDANPVLYREQLQLAVADEARRRRILTDPRSVDALTWGVFTSLETHEDPAWLAHRLQVLGGAAVRPPVRALLWVGREHEPLLRPSPEYVRRVRERVRAAGVSDRHLEGLEDPVEVPVLIETPDVVLLVETMLDRYPRGHGGRDRLLELVDVGRRHARRLSKALAVTVVHTAGTPGADEVTTAVRRLRDPAVLADELGQEVTGGPALTLQTLPWNELLALWQEEIPYLRLGGQPVRDFLAFAERLVGPPARVAAGRG